MRIPKKREVKNYGNLQNVITSVILRQKEMFTRKDVCEEVEAKIKFSSYGKYGKEREKVNVEGIIDDTIGAMYRIGKIGSICDNTQLKYYSI